MAHLPVGYTYLAQLHNADVASMLLFYWIGQLMAILCASHCFIVYVGLRRRRGPSTLCLRGYTDPLSTRGRNAISSHSERKRVGGISGETKADSKQKLKRCKISPDPIAKNLQVFQSPPDRDGNVATDRVIHQMSPQAASGAHLIALCSRQDLQEFPPSKPTQVIKPCLFKFNHQGIRRMNSGPRPQVKSSASTATPRRTSAQPQVTLMLAISRNALLIASRISVKRRRWKSESGARAGRGDLEVKGSRSWYASASPPPPPRPRAGPPMSSVRVLGTVAPHWHTFWRDDKLRQVAAPLVQQVAVCVRIASEGKSLVQECLTALTESVTDDVLLKAINLDLLMHTRSEDARLRISALACSQVLWRAHGGKLLGFVSETTTFIAECSEDEHDMVVRESLGLKNAVESVAGNISGL
ncbi:hypothetical protein B0H10DRAFT_2189187 [Mycena sp. CBHHK59/15]|nr:hypothetical protein B0H10DRAFT_2189187 [Mycena sp. CBHHK59/15]